MWLAPVNFDSENLMGPNGVFIVLSFSSSAELAFTGEKRSRPRRG
jgi:hypothetical protein